MNLKIGLVTGFVIALGLAAALVRPSAPAPAKVQDPPKVAAPDRAPEPVAAVHSPADNAAVTPAAAPRQSGPTRIGVVRLSECFDEKRYDKIKEVRAQFEAMLKELDEQTKGLEKEVKDAADKKAVAPSGSKAKMEAVKMEALARAKLQIHKETAKSIALNGYAKYQAEVYQEILRVIAVVGNEGGYDLILKLDEAKFEGENSPSEVSQEIAIKSVLYAAPAADLTEKVIQRLNQEMRK